MEQTNLKASKMPKYWVILFIERLLFIYYPLQVPSFGNFCDHRCRCHPQGPSQPSGQHYQHRTKAGLAHGWSHNIVSCFAKAGVTIIVGPSRMAGGRGTPDGRCPPPWPQWEGGGVIVNLLCHCKRGLVTFGLPGWHQGWLSLVGNSLH